VNEKEPCNGSWALIDRKEKVNVHLHLMFSLRTSNKCPCRGRKTVRSLNYFRQTNTKICLVRNGECKCEARKNVALREREREITVYL